jgi:predicted nucleic acid-binding protein
MRILVVDSSVIVKWLNKDNEEHIQNSDKLLNETREGRIELLAPELAKYEIGNVLLLGKKLIFSEAAKSISALYSIPLTFIEESKELAVQTYALAEDLGITYYDASFLSLAKQYDASLVTSNFKHHGKAHDISVVNLKDY